MPATLPKPTRYFTLVAILFVVHGFASFNRSTVGQEPDEPTQALSLAEKEQTAFQSAVAEVADCVVQIETFGGLQKVDNQVIAEGPTTGTILTADGWIISSLFNFRQQPASILINLPNGKREAAKLVARDFSRELVLLKVDGYEDLPFATAAESDSINVGSWSIALGKTYDPDFVSQSIGIISASGRAYGRAIQTDAKISPINYGGPLIDLRGQVLGILAPISPGAFFDGDSSELYDSGIGFAIPLPSILERLEDMQAGRDLRPGKLGIVTSTQNELAGPVDVIGWLPGSPAAKAGLQKGDRIVESDGQPINILAHLRHALAPVDAGKTFRFKILREGKELELETPLIEKIPTYYRRFLGFRLQQARGEGEQEDAEQDEKPDDIRWIVTGVEADSPAAQAGLAVGDVLLQVDSEVVDIATLRSTIAVAELDEPIVLTVRRGKDTKEVAIQPSTWPQELCPTLPEADPRIEENMQCEVVELLKDVANKSFGIIPPLKNERPLGLLIVFPEPGELDEDKTVNYWQDFCATQGWIVVVVNSANPRGWSREEFDLATRVTGNMQNSYEIDPARTVLAGLGIGGRMAMAVASSMPDRIQGVATFGTEMRGLQMGTSNFPLRSLDFLFVHTAEQVEAEAEIMRKAGYSAIVVPTPDAQPEKWESIPAEPLQRWLEGLARF